jgi:hypothetical protein
VMENGQLSLALVICIEGKYMLLICLPSACSYAPRKLNVAQCFYD